MFREFLTYSQESISDSMWFIGTCKIWTSGGNIIKSGTTFMRVCKIPKFHLICWCGNLEKTQGFRTAAKTVRFRKISAPGN